MTPYVVPLVSTLEALLGVEDKGLTNLIEGVDPDNAPETTQRNLSEALIPLLDRLPPREADVVEMCLILRKRQADIGYIFDVTQASVSYTLYRAIERLKFILRYDPGLTDDQIRQILKSTPLATIDIEILMDYRHTSQQNLTANNLGYSQARVRDRLGKASRKLALWAESRPDLRAVAKFFVALRDNPNILYRVEHPQWAWRGRRPRDNNFGARTSKRGVRK